ncbi:MAG: signal recognition particle protein [Pseudomonadota bacterium]|jgi:signal recognition particle subunit SRP54
MFENLSERLSACLRGWTGRTVLTEANLEQTLQEIKVALIDADAGLEVTQRFIERVKTAALGQKVAHGLSPGQFFIQLLQNELIDLMGKEAVGLSLRQETPVVILMAGLQGSGKTTSAAKLAKKLKEEEKKSVALVSCDIYRPAAVLQLQRLADELGVDFVPVNEGERPVQIAERALALARRQGHDVLIVDTAGRLHIDDTMMDEIQALEVALNPAEILFVVDSMTGQVAVEAARAFHDKLSLTGVILTKMDGDSRGGAALSIREITGKPIKFLGVGEKIDALEVFHPERIASRILGMGDVLTLIEEITRKVNKEKAEKLAKKVKKGAIFDLADFRDQLKQMMQMGGMGAMLDKMPGIAGLPAAAKAQVNDKQLVQMVAVVDSMTPKERRNPLLINGSRKRRIAGGAGVDIQKVNQVLKQHANMQKMMKKMTQKGGMSKMMRALQGKFQGFPGLPNF